MAVNIKINDIAATVFARFLPDSDFNESIKWTTLEQAHADQGASAAI